MSNMIGRFSLLCLCCCLSTPALSQEISPAFLETDAIRWSARQSEPVPAATRTWAEQFLNGLQLQGKSADERARAIWTAVRQGFAFAPDRPDTIADFIKGRSGNCYAHARLDLLLLRLAGLPAKYIYEVHLELKSVESERSARERGIGLFGHYHNDHFWILYFNGSTWVPFDTGFGILGFDGLRRRWDGETVLATPPFILWEDSGDPATGLVNVTARIWSQMQFGPHNGMTPERWKTFIRSWENVSLDLFMKPLDAKTLARIEAEARVYFGITG